MVTHVAENIFLLVSHVPASPNFWNHSLRPYNLTFRAAKFGVVTHVEWIVLIGVNHDPSQGLGPGVSKFWDLLSARTQYEKQQPNFAC